MFLRNLYGSRMPQPLHPRANDEISNYWREDTESSRELARMMDELENDDAADANGQKKNAMPIAVVDDAINGGAASRRGSLLSAALSANLATVAPFDALNSLNMDEINATPVAAQLSPTGLISIAAADIDEAGNAQTRELDLELLESIRRTANATPRQIVVENFMARILAASSSSTSAPTPLPLHTLSATPAQEESDPRLRFLSLLRRINELRSQQIQQDADVWDGLPYPQILALPTFKYTVRTKTSEQETSSSSASHEHKNNTSCAVCCMEYAAEEEVRALPCLHFYHRECIDQWLLHHRICPICKHVVAVY